MKPKTIIIHNIFMLICMIALVELLISPFASGKAGEWIKKKDMPVSTAWFPTVEFNGKIYLFDFSGGIWEYNPEKDSWIQKSVCVGGDYAAVLLNGKIYITDGGIGMYEYVPTTNKCTKKANLFFATRSTPISAVNEKIYAIGGVQDNIFHSAVQEYNPATDTWIRKKDLPFPLGWSSACTVGDKIYVFGGFRGDGAGGRATVMEYDPNADEWIQKADMSTRRGFLPKSAPVINGKVYVIGGYQNTALSVTEIYDLKTDTWTKGPDMPTARFALSTTAVKGKIYTFGGCLGANFQPGQQVWTTTVEEYDTGETFAVRAYGKLTTTWAALKK